MHRLSLFASFLEKREKMVGPLLIFAFFLLNLSIASRSPWGGWMDEVCYVDPGLNLAVGKGWISASYPYQTDHEFLAGTCPLYPGALSFWVRVFGISIVSCRAYCYSIAAIGMLFLWYGTFRNNLLPSGYRLLWIVILSSEYSMNWMERNERYDVWIFCGLAVAWFGTSVRTPALKCAVIFMGCFIVPFAGFVGVPYVVLLALIAAVLSNGKVWRESLSAVAGAGFGVLGVALFYLACGRLFAFIAYIRNMTVVQQSKQRALSDIIFFTREDYGVAVMIGLLIILSLYFWAYPLRRSNVWLMLGWAAVILIPTVMVLRGIFVMMYFYMLIVPLSLAVLQLAHLARGNVRGYPTALAVAIVMGTLSLGGLPARIYTSVKEWQLRDPQRRLEFVLTYIHPDDRVFSVEPFYFELRDRVRFLATPLYLQNMPEDEVRNLNVVLLKENGDSETPKRLLVGDGWKKIAVFPTPEMYSQLPGASKAKSYALYRRDVPSH